MGKIERVKATLARLLPSKEDLRVSIKNIVKSSLIGVFIGAIPGTGGDIAAFVSYGEAKRSSKYPERFGTGVIEGVAATESANNACSGGAMIPLLSLGVPGDSVTAVILGAFIIQGLQPGPLLYKEHLDVVYNVFSSMIVANIAMLIVGIVGIRFFVKVISIDKTILLPIIFVLSVVGSYAMRGNIFDIWLSLTFGLIGFLLQRYGFPLSPILLALILGPMAESNLRRSLVMSNGHWGILVSRPISVVLIVLAVVSIGISIWNHKRIEAKLKQG